MTSTSGPQRVMNDGRVKLGGKRTLVTGGASGIGLAIAKRAMEEGAQIAVADLAHDTPAPWQVVKVDVASEISVRQMIEQTIDCLGGLDVLIHCAGIGIQRDLLQTDLADWQRVIDVNLTGTFLCCREAARVMAPQKSGCIVAIASSSAVRPSIRSSAYAASKAGVANFVRAIAIDLAVHGIRVNAVSPGPVDTEMVQKMHSPEFRSGFTALIPQGRYGRPEEIAGAAVFLASDEASFITGSVLSVDGGFTSSGVIR